MSETSLETANPRSAGRRLVVGVRREQAPLEARVALVPDALAKLAPAGIDVLVESGAGDGAWFADASYVAAGATVLDGAAVLDRCDILVTVGALSREQVGGLRAGQAVLGMLRPLVDPELAQMLAEREVTVISLDTLARTVSRAQSMDALSSQANIAGYKAVLVAANAFGRFFPMLITAAGTAKPADVLVLGAGVAGLQAMGTARRLGAMVTGYDVRPATRTEIESVGARFLELSSVGPAAGEGGYARALTEEEQAAQQAELDGLIGRFDIVITTAQVPGRRPPVLVTAAALRALRPGSVVVDLAASVLGGNVEGSKPDGVVLTDNGVTVIGAPNLPSQMATAASRAFSTNVTSLLLALVSDGSLVIDLEDEIQQSVVIAHGGEVVHAAVSGRLDELTEKGRP